MNISGSVVVAVDGSESSWLALQWGVQEASTRAVPLVACHVSEWGGWQPELTPLPDDPAKANSPGERVVAEAVARARALAPGLAVSGATGHGHPADVLVRASTWASAMVLGSRGLGGFEALRLGSVSAQVAAHGRCPVAVVHRPSRSGAHNIVVGVDDSVPSEMALELGIDEARRRGGHVIAVHAYQLPPSVAGYGPFPGVNVEGVREAAQLTLDRALKVVDAEAAGVRVEPRLVCAPAAWALVDCGADAALIAVGARGGGGFAGLVLGSVSHQVIRHAPCPVLVAH